MAQAVIPYNRALPEAPGRTPWTEPDIYLEKLGEGDYAVRQGRRPSNMFLVEKLRHAVDDWREDGYTGISPVTRRLFEHWFEEDHLMPDGGFWRYWWAQREAIETLVYLFEVSQIADFKPLAEDYGEKPKFGLLTMDFNIHLDMNGQRMLTRWVPEKEQDATVELPAENLIRYAFKMATGTGKTEVMAMVVVWAYLNRKLCDSSSGLWKRLADNFLIVAPNVIVFERLERDFANNAIFNSRPLIPAEWKGQWSLKVILRGESAAPDPSGNLFLVNIQQIYESRQEEWQPANPLDAILGVPPNKDLASYQTSMLDRIKSLNNLMVLNDEAHHVHDDDLAWNQTLLALDENLRQMTGHGLALWLDFSATPKTQAGTYYPWTIMDYPLAQAIEDQVVKAPLIVHQVNKRDPQKVTQENIFSAYHDWIVVALERWKEHTKVFRSVGQKPVLFVMVERTAYADALAEELRKAARLKKDDVLVIHTDTKGNLTKKELDVARDAAREVDKSNSPIKIIVSVLMLREGWDVRNVTVILGLRPFTAKAEILPEQAVGRGLRLMNGISPDNRQTLEVIGTDAFEGFVRQLEQEGVGIDTVGDPPPLPIKIYPVQDKIDYDIAIPITKLRYKHEYRKLDAIDPLTLPPIYTTDDLAEELAIAIRMEFATTGTTVHETYVIPESPLLSQDFMRDITQSIERRLELSGRFAQLMGIVKKYIKYRCFGVEVDLDDAQIIRHLRDPMLQEGIAAFLSRQIAKLATEQREIEFEDAHFELSQTQTFTWRRKHVRCKRTIFNECAVFNNLEERFAKFLDDASDILSFAALAESFTRFRVDYLNPHGAIKLYYPDFVAVQKIGDEITYWILETKGREDENVVHKDAAILNWCENITAQTGKQWRYLKIPQVVFDKFKGKKLVDLVKAIANIGNERESFLPAAD
jgi:type III restriction enzyme